MPPCEQKAIGHAFDDQQGQDDRRVKDLGIWIMSRTFQPVLLLEAFELALDLEHVAAQVMQLIASLMDLGIELGDCAERVSLDRR